MLSQNNKWRSIIAKQHQMGIWGDVGACKKTPPEVTLSREAYEKKKGGNGSCMNELQEHHDGFLGPKPFLPIGNVSNQDQTTQ